MEAFRPNWHHEGSDLSGVDRKGGLGGRAGAARMAERAGLADERLQAPLLHVARQQLCPILVAQLHGRKSSQPCAHCQPCSKRSSVCLTDYPKGT